MHNVLSDLRYGLRTLLRDPGFAAVAVLTLALGIGANTALFSVIHGVLMRPLPYPNPERLARIWSTDTRRGWIRGGNSVQDFVDFRERATSFAEVGVYDERSANLTGAFEPENVDFSLVSPSVFTVLGTPPLLGRTFAEDENLPGRDQVAVLSYALFQRAFGGDSGVLGRTVELSGETLEIVGVMPEEFGFPSTETEIWKPFGMLPDDGGPRGARWVYVIARLKEGISRERAQSEMDRIARALESEYPDSNANVGAFVEPLLDASVESARPGLFVLWGAVGLVLLIACANTANLTLARSSARTKEMHLRAALGAGRGRLVSQMLTESVLLSFLAAAVGIALAYWGVRLLPRLSAGTLPRVHEVSIDGTVLAFSVALALATGILFGLLPAMSASSVARNQSLQQRGGSPGGTTRVGSTLVVSEVALALVLLIGSGLLIRSFTKLLQVDMGFDPGNLLTLRVEPPQVTLSAFDSRDAAIEAFEEDRSRVNAFYEQLVERVDALPEVVSSGAVNRLPLSGNMWGTTMAFDHRPVATPRDMVDGFARPVTPGYFAAMRIPLEQGRPLSWFDDAQAPRVALVSRALVRAYFEEEDPIGRRITFGFPDESSIWYTVVGVVGDVRHNTLAVAPRPMVYTPVAQSYFGFFGNWGVDLVVRTSSDPLSVVGAVREQVRSLNPALPVFRVRSMEQVIGDDVARRRFTMLLLAGLAMTALLMAAVGIYGVLSYTVGQRTQELGVRMALGASRQDVLGAVLRHGGVMTLAGIGIGVTFAVMLTRFLENLLFETTPTDPAAFIALTLALGAVALVACLVPALRATRVQPIEALRHD